MKDLLKSMKFWQITFLVLAALSISPLFIEFLMLTVIPLVVVGTIASILAFKERKFYMIALNVLVVLGSVAWYIYIW